MPCSKLRNALAGLCRSAAHCIEYAHLIQWGQERPGEEFDADVEEHMKWVYDKATARAEQFGIPVSRTPDPVYHPFNLLQLCYPIHTPNNHASRMGFSWNSFKYNASPSTAVTEQSRPACNTEICWMSQWLLCRVSQSS